MKYIKLRFVKPILWGVELLVIVSLLGSIISLVKKKDIIRSRQSDLTRVQAENEQLKEKLREVQGNVFIEREARDKLGLVKPGEVMVLVGKGIATPSSHPSQMPVVSRWQEWWKWFF